MQTYPRTTVTWDNEMDSPDPDISEIRDASVTIHGNRLTIRRRDEVGRMAMFDVLLDPTMKQSGDKVVATGTSEHMVTKMNLDPDDAQVTIHFEGGGRRCLTCS